MYSDIFLNCCLCLPCISYKPVKTCQKPVSIAYNPLINDIFNLNMALRLGK